MITKASKQNAKKFKSKLLLRTLKIHILNYVWTKLFCLVALWVRFDANSSDKHQLFFKEHSIRNQEPEYPKNQTLFVLNVPPYATIDCLRNAFTNLCGNVLSVTFSNSKGFKTAYIVFKKESSLDKAMELSKDSVITLKSEKNVCLTGLESKLYLYNIIEIIYFSQFI